jgi:hypothetical protein
MKPKKAIVCVLLIALFSACIGQPEEEEPRVRVTRVPPETESDTKYLARAHGPFFPEEIFPGELLMEHELPYAEISSSSCTDKICSAEQFGLALLKFADESFGDYEGEEYTDWTRTFYTERREDGEMDVDFLNDILDPNRGQIPNLGIVLNAPFKDTPTNNLIYEDDEHIDCGEVAIKLTLTSEDTRNMQMDIIGEPAFWCISAYDFLKQNCEEISKESTTNLHDGSLILVDESDWKSALSAAALSREAPVLISSQDGDTHTMDVFREQFNPIMHYVPRSPELIADFWEKAPYVIITDPDDYSTALYASALASRCKVPLLYTDSDFEGIASTLGSKKIFVGVPADDGSIQLGIPEINIMLAKGSHYLILTNSEDEPKFSMAAPIMAGGRDALLLDVQDASTKEAVKRAIQEASRYMDIDYIAIVSSYENFPIVGLRDDCDPVLGWTNCYTAYLDYYGDLNDDDYIDAATGVMMGYTPTDTSGLVARSLWYDKMADSTDVFYWAPYTSVYDERAFDYQEGVSSSVDPAINSRIINHFTYSDGDVFSEGSSLDDVKALMSTSSVFVYDGHASSTGIYGIGTDDMPDFEQQPAMMIVHGCATLRPWWKRSIAMEAVRNGAAGWYGAADLWFTSGVFHGGIPNYDLPQSGSPKGLLELLDEYSVGEAHMMVKNDMIAYDKVNEREEGGTGHYIFFVGDPFLKPWMSINTLSRMNVAGDEVTLSTPYISNIKTTGHSYCTDFSVPYFTGRDAFMTEPSGIRHIIWLNERFDSAAPTHTYGNNFKVSLFKSAPCVTIVGETKCPHLVILEVETVMEGGKRTLVMPMPSQYTLTFRHIRRVAETARTLEEIDLAKSCQFFNDEYRLCDADQISMFMLLAADDVLLKGHGRGYVPLLSGEDEVDLARLQAVFYRHEDSFEKLSGVISSMPGEWEGYLRLGEEEHQFGDLTVELLSIGESFDYIEVEVKGPHTTKAHKLERVLGMTNYIDGVVDDRKYSIAFTGYANIAEERSISMHAIDLSQHPDGSFLIFNPDKNEIRCGKIPHTSPYIKHQDFEDVLFVGGHEAADWC